MSPSESPVPSPQSRRCVNGILLLDKPLGLSSNQALQKARRLFAAAKAGHTGSLDPLATGLLPVCFGEATKIAGYLLGSRKAYTAEVRLGATTTTDDAEGEILLTRPVPELDPANLEAGLKPLRGRIVQTPPVYSALKQGGVPLYRRARRGEDVEAPPREVEIYRLDVLEHAGDWLRLHVECGSGTYVRSLARDLGERLGCGAHLSALRRDWVDPFREPRMFTLESLDELRADGGVEALDRLLLSTDAGLAAVPELRLDAERATRLGHGQRLVCPDTTLGFYRATNEAGQLLALVDIDAEGLVSVRRGFNTSAS